MSGPLLDFNNGIPKRIHLIGVAGSGMSGIAGLLLALGHKVSGSDRHSSVETQRLQSLGLQFSCPHSAEVVRDAELVVYSSAVHAGNSAFDEAERLKIPKIRRAEALAALLHYKKGIVVAGMHGKTTTSALAAHVLREAGIKPSYYVGAEIPILGTNSHWENGSEYFVAEGDESDGTLSLYHPTHSIILNIEEEHLDYYSNLDSIEKVYAQLSSQTSGTVFYCKDDENSSRICEKLPNSFSFGFSKNADCHGSEPVTEKFHSRFEVFFKGKYLGDAELNVPGRHNVSNALGVIALSLSLGIPFPKILLALKSFRGARRRFEFLHQGSDYTLVDDYGHHPTEIKATLATARAGHQGRIVVAFQPHRYTRTQTFQKEFGSAFDSADVVYITDIYSAGEIPIEGISGEVVANSIRERGKPHCFYCPEKSELRAKIGATMKPGDLVISLGAGDIHEVTKGLCRDVVDFEKIVQLLRGDGSRDGNGDGKGDGIVKLYEPLSRHTTMRVGGAAHFWVEPTTEVAFAKIVKFAKENNFPLLVMGRGSNLLVSDSGFSGIVVHPVEGEFGKIEIDLEKCLVNCGVGVPLKKLANTVSKSGITGFEWMDGIPGALGGSLRMNAGAMGHEMFGQVVLVRLIDSDGKIYEKTPSELTVRYRSIPNLDNEFAVSAILKGEQGEREVIVERLEEAFVKRKRSQPLAAASAGCIFKNPSPNLPAGKLIEELGLKGYRVGGAVVSEIHGNFIVNEGNATSKDVVELINHIKNEAMTKRGVALELEVRSVGNF